MNELFTKNIISLNTILKKEIFRFMRIWTQSLLPPVITITLYFIVFGKLIGSQINNIEGYTYMQYIVPGLIMMSIMTSSYSNTSSSFFGSKFSKSIEEILVSSMPNYIILLGYMLSGALRGLLVGMLVMTISCLFTHIHIYNIWMMLFIATLTSLLFSLAGLVNGIFAKKFDDVTFIPTFILTPLTYLGGVFYSVQQLSPMWQTLSKFNPIFIMVSSFKYSMHGIYGSSIYLGLFTLIVLFIILFIWCYYLIEKGIGLRS
ncbi:ABC transporter permease [Gammaproteobacteria bacterium]|nr:ABC transporter permease [Gammaproteobacteria bacterium]